MTQNSLFYRLHRKLKALPVKLGAQPLVEYQWRNREQFKSQYSHNLPGELIVNLTSFPPRFSMLHLTLKSLLLQEIQADKVILWLYEQDIEKLPESVSVLQRCGLTIKSCPRDIRSYKKLVPAFDQWPHAFLVTADDDVYYRRDWLTELVNAYQPQIESVYCHRVHRIIYDSTGNESDYKNWIKYTQDTGPAENLMFTGVGGVLYPPGSLHELTSREDLFMHIAPYADDIWFYWMVRAKGYCVTRVGENNKLVSWKSSKASSLWSINKQAAQGNDVQFAQVKHYLQQHGLIE